MAEGMTRWRYLIAYGIEAFENTVSFGHLAESGLSCEQAYFKETVRYSKKIVLSTQYKIKYKSRQS